MATIRLSDEALEIVNQEAMATGIKPEALIERAVKEARLRRELQKGHESIKAGRVKPLDLSEIFEAAKKRSRQGT